uniref:Uncharacterized protein n=1 Tax=Mus musculus TaxID=10090 RepID=Q9D0Q5_MOUSE|nr:unnamed protein product [Mus musculus]
MARTTVGSVGSVTLAARSCCPNRSSRGPRGPGLGTCSRRVLGSAFSVWTSEGVGTEGRIRGPWWTACTMGVHLTPGILTPGIPGSLPLSRGGCSLREEPRFPPPAPSETPSGGLRQ